MIWVLVLFVVVALVYVRMAPVDVAAVHSSVEAVEDKDGEGFCLRVVTASEGALARVDAAMRALPRTELVAGSVGEGRITYVTRSKWIGFPDYTTIEETAGQVRMFARLRFGKSDFGVNKARLREVMRKAQVGG